MKKGIITLALALAAAAASIFPTSFSAPASAAFVQKSVVIDFEDLSPGPVTDQYARLGVIFNQPSALDYQRLPGFAHSGVKGIEQCQRLGPCNTPIEMSFSAGRRRVKVWVGYSSPLDTSQTVILRALDARGTQVGQATATLNPSPDPQPIRTPLEIILPNASIRRALVSFSTSKLPTNSLAVDDIEFDAPAPTPTPTPVPTPQGVVIDFESISTGPVTNQYSNLGVIFNQPTALNYQHMPGFAHSGVKAIEQCFAQEFCNAPIDMSFTTGQRRVKVWVGVSQPLNTSQTVVLRALDANGTQIGQATATLNPSSSPRPINTPLEVILPNADIRRAVISYSPTDLGSYWLAVDDVEFDAAGPPPPCASAQNPTLSLIRPANNQIVQFDGFILEAQVNSQDPLAVAMTLTVTGPGGSKSQQLPLANGKFGPTWINGMLFPGLNLITAKFQDCRGSVQRSVNLTYTPIPEGTSFELHAIEVTQATQGEHNFVPLVANKAAVARVFLSIHSPLGQTATIRDVYGKLVAQRREGAGWSDYLPPGELSSLNMITVNTSDDLATKRASLNATINFELPAEWVTEGDLHLSFRPHIKDSPSSPSNLPCSNCENLFPTNSMPRYVTFRPTRPLNLILAPYDYQPNSDPMFPLSPELLITPSVALQWTNNVFPLPGNFPSSESGINLLRILPGKLTTRDLGPFGNRGAFLDDLEEVLADLQSQGGLPGDVRLLGMVPFGKGGAGRFNGQVAFVDTWATQNGPVPEASFEGYGNTWAHELGHNFGRQHSGNWHGEDSGGGYDENFPYFHGGIGLPGLAITTYWWKPGGAPYLIAPGTLNPLGPHAHDFMSYGHVDPSMNTGMWVSPYTYSGLFDKFGLQTNMALAQSAQPAEKLIVIGRIDADGSIVLKPFHREITGFSYGSGAFGEFSLELLDAEGRVLVEHRFDAQPDSHDESGAMGFSVFAPWHAGARRIAIKRKDTVLAERAVSPNAPTVRVLSPSGGESLGKEADIVWEASDPDGDPLSYTVFYNDGSNPMWWPVATGVSTTTVKVDTSLWPGSSKGWLKVRVTDGVNTAEDVTDRAFTVPRKSPMVAIINAEALRKSGLEAKAQLIGVAYDPEDGLLPESKLVWTSDRDGLIDKGSRLNLKSLSSGTHTITLTVTDSHGQRTTAQTLDIVRPPVSK